MIEGRKFQSQIESEIGKDLPDSKRDIEKLMKELMPKDFELPDLSPTKEGEYMRHSKSEFDFEYQDQKWQGEFEFERAGGDWPLKIRLIIKDPEVNAGKEDEVSMFSMSCRKGPSIGRYRSKENKDDIHGVIYYRKVEEDYRGQGFGDVSFGILEKISRDIRSKYPDINIKQLEVNTRASSMARLIIDQGWLDENDLGRLKKTKGGNLGYFPNGQDIERAKYLLDQEYDTEQSSRIEEEVQFSKKI